MKSAASHLYIHWPFCKYKCHFCDFVAFARHETFMQRYHHALCNEIRSYAKLFGTGSIRTVFLGGGTPSTYPPDLLADLFLLLNSCFDMKEVIETTIEVNPGGLSEELFAQWKRCGINRASIGVQVLDDAVLARLNRHQKVADVKWLFEHIGAYISNRSVDLILGLPGVNSETWEHTLERVCSWDIQHCSMYFLTVHDQTPLFFNIKQGKMQLIHDDALVELYLTSAEKIEQAGFLQYELSNFAKDGYESLHNKAYWDRRPYQGFGVGAASFDGVVRTRNSRRLVDYLAYYEAGPCERMQHEYRESIDAEQQKLEEYMLGLRQAKGLDLHRVVYSLGEPARRNKMRVIKQLSEQGLLMTDAERIRLTRKGLALEHEIVLALL